MLWEHYLKLQSNLRLHPKGSPSLRPGRGQGQHPTGDRSCTAQALSEAFRTKQAALPGAGPFGEAPARRAGEELRLPRSLQEDLPAPTKLGPLSCVASAHAAETWQMHHEGAHLHQLSCGHLCHHPARTYAKVLTGACRTSRVCRKAHSNKVSPRLIRGSLTKVRAEIRKTGSNSKVIANCGPEGQAAGGAIAACLGAGTRAC